jgi:hypothetical protein
MTKLSGGTAMFHELQKRDKIGHKIIGYVECDSSLNVENTLVFLKEKARRLIKKHRHFGCVIVGDHWTNVPKIYMEEIVYHFDGTHHEFAEQNLNKPFPQGIPCWRLVVTNNQHIVFMCDHVYGDAGVMEEIMASLFDDHSKKERNEGKKPSYSLFSRIVLFFKVLYLLYKRYWCMKTESQIEAAPWAPPSRVEQCHLATLSLSELKKNRERFSCSDGSKITINDMLHSLIVKTCRENLKKSTITSAAMFNLRNQEMTIDSEQNQVGYIILANEVKSSNTPPEEVIRDVHDFMQFYKVTPVVPCIAYGMKLYYDWDREKACNLIRNTNKSVDFIISNYAFPYENKTTQGGVAVKNVIGTATPCDANQIYSITSYGDHVNIYLTYKADKVKELEMLKRQFTEAVKWLEM